MKKTIVEEVSEYPMRINKYLAHKGYTTRRAADELIKKERVLINGRIADIGDKVLEKDEVVVRKGRGEIQKEYVYYAYNKPRGIITHSPQGEEISIVETLPEEATSMGLFPVGRLDKDSHGLLILTNDGRITDRLLSPSRDHEKEYVVHTKKSLRPSFKQHMEEGVLIEGYQTLPTKVGMKGDKTFSVSLTEGKKHQIRRMVVALHNEVDDLQRVRIMNIRLGTLKKGGLRKIEDKELTDFMTSLGLGSESATVKEVEAPKKNTGRRVPSKK
jgi:23S rRNA pseudouridine2604 synthase